jgi:signal transduction histidine kinase
MLTLGDPGHEVWYRFFHGNDRGLSHPVLSRWARARELRASERNLADGLGSNKAFTDGRDLGGLSCELLKTGAEELRRRGFALLVADARGVLRGSCGSDALPDWSHRFLPGARWDEAASGTNAIGTALAEDTPVTVIGRAHLDPSAHGLVCYAAPVHDAQGEPFAVLDATGPVAAADPLLGVTVQSLAAAFEGALRARALEELQGRLRLNETFVASIGHDLRNPLTAVLNGADMMIARSGDSNHRVLAERIRSSGRRMYHLVDQLSDLTRARLAGGIRLALGDEVDLAAVVERAAVELELAHPDRQIVVTTVGDARGHWDAARMEQVVSNLVGNALRHGTGARPVHVGIDGTRTDRIFLSVTNGGEIAASVLPHLFDPFHPSKTERTRSDGLGLGLYIVEQIVRAHQGRIEVLTRSGATTFCVALPRRV